MHAGSSWPRPASGGPREGRGWMYWRAGMGVRATRCILGGRHLQDAAGWRACRLDVNVADVVEDPSGAHLMIKPQWHPG